MNKQKAAEGRFWQLFAVFLLGSLDNLIEK
jgi:hypothetical protein